MLLNIAFQQEVLIRTGHVEQYVMLFLMVYQVKKLGQHYEKNSLLSFSVSPFILVLVEAFNLLFSLEGSGTVYKVPYAFIFSDGILLLL